MRVKVVIAKVFVLVCAGAINVSGRWMCVCVFL